MFQYTFDDILSLLGDYELRGKSSALLTGIHPLKGAQSGDLSFLGNAKYKADVADTKASCVLLPRDWSGEPSASGQCFILVDNPSLALARICRDIETKLRPQPQAGIHPSAVIAESASVAKSASIGAAAVIDEGAVVGAHSYIGPQAYVGHKATVGEDCYLASGVKLMDNCSVGNRVSVQSSAVIGSDGFGYEFSEGKHQKVPQIGNVILEDDVDIGSNTSIDRARFGSTVIGEGSKVDNLVQIAHNVKIGKYCIIVAQAGISGSTQVDDYAIIGGQVGIAGHLHIGKGAQLGAQSGVNHDIEAGSKERGTPSMPFMLMQRVDVLRKHMPELFKRVAKLEEFMEHSGK